MLLTREITNEILNIVKPFTKRYKNIEDIVISPSYYMEIFSNSNELLASIVLEKDSEPMLYNAIQKDGNRTSFTLEQLYNINNAAIEAWEYLYNLCDQSPTCQGCPFNDIRFTPFCDTLEKKNLEFLQKSKVSKNERT